MDAKAELNELILELYYDDIINDDKVFLYDLNFGQTYWQYPAFDREQMEDHECEV